MSNKAQTRGHVTALFKSFAGQNNSLVIPRPYIDFCKGDHLAALLFSQILYWSDRTDDPDGWFAKTYDEWYRELCMTEYQVRRAIKGDKRSNGRAFSLESVGVETALRKSKFHHGAATLHYRVDQTVLRKSVAAFMSDLNNVEDTPQTMFRSLPQQRSERSTETTTEIKTLAAPAQAQAQPPTPSKPKRKRQPAPIKTLADLDQLHRIVAINSHRIKNGQGINGRAMVRINTAVRDMRERFTDRPVEPDELARAYKWHNAQDGNPELPADSVKICDMVQKYRDANTLRVVRGEPKVHIPPGVPGCPQCGGAGMWADTDGKSVPCPACLEAERVAKEAAA